MLDSKVQLQTLMLFESDVVSIDFKAAKLIDCFKAVPGQLILKICGESVVKICQLDSANKTTQVQYFDEILKILQYRIFPAI